MSQFHIEHDDLASIGSKLHGLAEGFSDDEFRKFFMPGGLWWEDSDNNN